MTAINNLYILGHPVKHSKSPAMYNAVFKELNIAWEYGLAECATTQDARSFLEKREFYALNITTPYKPLALEAATLKAASARLARGANVLVTKDAQLIAYNVDGQGCISALERAGVSFSEAKVVVCGTGPTSLAIIHAAAQAGAADILLVGRDKEHAREVLEKYVSDFRFLTSTTVDMPASVDHHLSFREAYDHAAFRFGSYATSTKAIAAADVIIDATPLGMKSGDPAPFDTALLSANQTVCDVVYGHGVTALIAAAREKGCKALDGSGMLVAQAVLSVRIFFDIAEVELELSDEELFDIMGKAAGFDQAV